MKKDIKQYKNGVKYGLMVNNGYRYNYSIKRNSKSNYLVGLMSSHSNNDYKYMYIDGKFTYSYVLIDSVRYIKIAL